MADADDDAEMIAVAGLRPPAPWVLLESSTFTGRFYFFNTTSLESKWSLPSNLFAAKAALYDSSGNDAGAEKLMQGALTAAQNMVARMESRYGDDSRGREGFGASPSRPDADFDASTAFHKRARDLDPRLMSIDLEEKLRSALSKADQIERQWAEVSIPEEESSPTGENGAAKPARPHAGSQDAPSAESFAAMRDVASSWDDDGGGASGPNHGGSGGGVSLSEALDSAGLYTVLNGLGSGGYSNVLLARHKERQDLVAMKVLSKRLLKRPRDRARLKNELRALTEIPPSQFIQRCFAAFESPSHVCFVTEYLGGGDLFFHLTRRVDAAPEDAASGAGFSEHESRVLLAEITLGLEHMHAHNFIHCDIKVENIMLDARGHVKLIDFGLSQEISQEEEPMSPIGSLIYMAPELLTKSMGGRHTDWWALGVLAHEMMTGRSPWSSLTDKKLIKRQIRTLKIAPPQGLSPSAGAFVCALLTQDLKQRLGTSASSEVRKHPFFTTAEPSPLSGDAAATTASTTEANAPIDWPALEKGTAPPALVPPRVAFIEAECANALLMYQQAPLEPADWTLGVERVQRLPACVADPAEGALPAVTAALKDAGLAGTSFSDENSTETTGQKPQQKPQLPLPTPPPQQPPAAKAKGSRSTHGSSSSSSSSGAATTRPPPAGGSQRTNSVSSHSSSTSSKATSSGLSTRKLPGATPRANLKPKTPTSVASAAAATGGGLSARTPKSSTAATAAKKPGQWR